MRYRKICSTFLFIVLMAINGAISGCALGIMEDQWKMKIGKLYAVIYKKALQEGKTPEEALAFSQIQIHSAMERHPEHFFITQANIVALMSIMACVPLFIGFFVGKKIYRASEKIFWKQMITWLPICILIEIICCGILQPETFSIEGGWIIVLFVGGILGTFLYFIFSGIGYGWGFFLKWLNKYLDWPKLSLWQIATSIIGGIIGGVIGGIIMGIVWLTLSWVKHTIISLRR